MKLLTTALLALALAGPALASDPLPPELAALKAKAERGNVIAQYNLGLAYASNSNGAPLDPAEAYVWLTLASRQGSTGKALESLVSGMSPETMAEGRQRLAAERSRIAAGSPAAVPTIKPSPQAPAPSSPAARPDFSSPNARIEELQKTIDQLTAVNRQQAQQLDERGQALLQALAQIASLKNAQPGKDDVAHPQNLP